MEWDWLRKFIVLEFFSQNIGWDNPEIDESIKLRLIKVELRVKELATRLDSLFL